MIIDFAVSELNLLHNKIKSTFVVLQKILYILLIIQIDGIGLK